MLVETENVKLTDGNIRNSYIRVRQFNALMSTDTGKCESEILLELEGVGQIKSNIDKKKGILAERKAIKCFFEVHKLKPGDEISLRKIGESHFEVATNCTKEKMSESTIAGSIDVEQQEETLDKEQMLLFKRKEKQKAAEKTKRLKNVRRANDLDGVRWLTNSISVWSDIRKTRIEQDLKHPAMFPSMLVERFIESFTARKQKVVFDPFMGSGSTLVAARKMGKYGVGIELNPKYVHLAKDQLEDLFDKSSPKTEYIIHTADARQLLDYVKPNSVDITITSPPYWDILNQRRTADSKAIRNYGNLDSDLSTIHDYRNFLDSLQEIFECVHVVMKPERYCIVVVMDLRKKDKFFPFHSDVAEMMQRAGFIYDDLIIWNRQSEYNNLRPLGYPSVFRINKVHEFCLIFKTREPKEKRVRDKEILGKRKLS